MAHLGIDLQRRRTSQKHLLGWGQQKENHREVKSSGWTELRALLHQDHRKEKIFVVIDQIAVTRKTKIYSYVRYTSSQAPLTHKPAINLEMLKGRVVVSAGVTDSRILRMSEAC